MSNENDDQKMTTDAQSQSAVGVDIGESSTEEKSTEGRKKKGGKKRKQSTLTYEEYLKYAYQRNGQRLTISETDYAAVMKSIREDVDYRALLSTQIEGDINLKVPFELVMLADSKPEFPLFQRSLLDFVLKVMTSLAIFQRPIVRAALSMDAAAATVSDAVNEVIKNDVLSSGASPDAAGKDVVDGAILSRNAAKTIIAWHAVLRDISFDELAAMVNETLWRDAMREMPKGLSTLRRRMIETDDDWVCGWISRSANQKVADARQARSSAVSQVNDLSDRLAKSLEAVLHLKEEVERLGTEKDGLQAELKRIQAESEERDRQSRIELGYEIQTLKGEFVAVLESATSKLSNGLAAAARAATLSTVLVERAELVLEALTQQLHALKTEDNDVTP
jgi:hypothetical protein